MKCIDISGQKFNRLFVIEKFDSTKSGVRWRCVCDCGSSVIANTLKIRSGLTKSCGCLKSEKFTNKKHGMANKTKTYKTWKEMRRRCTNQNAIQYKYYGGRGISVCEEWDSFEIFLKDMGERPDGMTLDRIDPDKGYSKNNCRWATAKQQAETNRGCFKKASK